MNLHVLKLMLLSCMVFQASCDITFKRKVANTEDAHVEMSEHKNISSKDNTRKKYNKSGTVFSKKDSHLIVLYYSDIANAIIRKDMITHTKTSEKQEKKLVRNKKIPRDIQVMPLPLKLEKTLSPLPLHMLRVQVGTRVILMNVKLRRILDIIKI